MGYFLLLLFTILFIVLFLHTRRAKDNRLANTIHAFALQFTAPERQAIRTAMAEGKPGRARAVVFDRFPCAPDEADMLVQVVLVLPE